MRPSAETGSGAVCRGSRPPPPVPAQKADLVRHQALLQKGAVRVAGGAGAPVPQRGQFHDAVDESQGEPQLNQTVCVRLLRKNQTPKRSGVSRTGTSRDCPIIHVPRTVCPPAAPEGERPVKCPWPPSRCSCGFFPQESDHSAARRSSRRWSRLTQKTKRVQPNPELLDQCSWYRPERGRNWWHLLGLQQPGGSNSLSYWPAVFGGTKQSRGRILEWIHYISMGKNVWNDI